MAARADSIPDEVILAMPLRGLAALLRGGTLSATAALAAFRRRTEYIDGACNAVMCYIDEAQQWAEAADEHLRRTGQPLGPLHGVPCSIKDHISVKGTVTTYGYELVKRHGEPDKQDAIIVAALRRAGAIPFCKTTMAQGGRTAGGGSPAHGDTLNPWDTLRSPGGSSSGEGALVGGGASPFGIGSDIGGSVRFPSAFCGICGLKPTTMRMPHFNLTGPKWTVTAPSGGYHIPGTAGFMAKRVEDIAEVCAAFLAEPLYEMEANLPPLPFNQKVWLDSRRLRIGWFLEEYCAPRACPAVARGVRLAVEALERAGHTLVPFRAMSEGHVKEEDCFACDGALHSYEAELVLAGKLVPDSRLHPVTDAIIKSAYISENFPKTPSPSAGQYMGAIAYRDRIRDKFGQYWTDLGIDVLLTPAAHVPAVPVEEVAAWHLGPVGYHLRLFNLLDYPAGVVPVTKVTAEDLRQPYDPGTKYPEGRHAALAAFEGSEGLPVAVQIAALPFREELCLRAMREVERLLPFDATQHARLQPVPRRSPELGARPQLVAAGVPASKL